MIASLLKPLVDGLIAVVLAPHCLSCQLPLDEPTSGPICARCWASIPTFTPPLCARCGDPLASWRTISLDAGRCPRCRRTDSAIAVSRAVGPYAGSLREIVHALKYGGCRSLAAPLASRMRASAADVLAAADVVVAVPLHRRRRRLRGFNQADEIAARLGVRVAPVLRRIRATPSQTDLPAARRHANMRGAFALRRGSSVAGLRIVLVDDVCTTGATLEACARVLRDAGAAEISALTAARVSSRPIE
jgi:ComF family protein